MKQNLENITKEYAPKDCILPGMDSRMWNVSRWLLNENRRHAVNGRNRADISRTEAEENRMRAETVGTLAEKNRSSADIIRSNASVIRT